MAIILINLHQLAEKLGISSYNYPNFTIVVEGICGEVLTSYEKCIFIDENELDMGIRIADFLPIKLHFERRTRISFTLGCADLNQHPLSGFSGKQIDDLRIWKCLIVYDYLLSTARYKICYLLSAINRGYDKTFGWNEVIGPQVLEVTQKKLSEECRNAFSSGFEYEITILGKVWMCEIPCTYEKYIIYDEEFGMGECIPIPICIRNWDIFSEKSRIDDFIDGRGSIHARLKDDAYIDSSVVCLYDCSENILVCPCIYLDPYTFLRLSYECEELLLHLYIWQYPYICMGELFISREGISSKMISEFTSIVSIVLICAWKKNE